MFLLLPAIRDVHLFGVVPFCIVGVSFDNIDITVNTELYRRFEIFREDFSNPSMICSLSVRYFYETFKGILIHFSGILL